MDPKEGWISKKRTACSFHPAAKATKRPRQAACGGPASDSGASSHTDAAETLRRADAQLLSDGAQGACEEALRESETRRLHAGVAEARRKSQLEDIKEMIQTAMAPSSSSSDQELSKFSRGSEGTPEDHPTATGRAMLSAQDRTTIRQLRKELSEPKQHGPYTHGSWGINDDSVRSDTPMLEIRSGQDGAQIIDRACDIYLFNLLKGYTRTNTSTSTSASTSTRTRISTSTSTSTSTRTNTNIVYYIDFI